MYIYFLYMEAESIVFNLLVKHGHLIASLDYTVSKVFEFFFFNHSKNLFSLQKTENGKK